VVAYGDGHWSICELRIRLHDHDEDDDEGGGLTMPEYEATAYITVRATIMARVPGGGA
jgi:hypothetical protein